MEILNLVYPEESTIKYEIHSFPDGQQNIKLLTSGVFDVEIKSRMNSWRDVELIICANQALKSVGAKKIKLYVPYFLGSRSDRRFCFGEPHYLRDIICPLINTQKFNSIEIMDPHSNVLESCLKRYSLLNFIKYNNFIEWALNDINVRKIEISLVSPDTGAYKKSVDLFHKYGFGHMAPGFKYRFPDGRIAVQADLTEVDIDKINSYVIVDDICDGGGTFIEIAKKIKQNHPWAKIYLIVTHGIFSKGLYDLNRYFEKIYTTNSFREIENPLLKQYEVFK